MKNIEKEIHKLVTVNANYAISNSKNYKEAIEMVEHSFGITTVHFVAIKNAIKSEIIRQALDSDID